MPKQEQQSCPKCGHIDCVHWDLYEDCGLCFWCGHIVYLDKPNAEAGIWKLPDA